MPQPTTTPTTRKPRGPDKPETRYRNALAGASMLTAAQRGIVLATDEATLDAEQAIIDEQLEKAVRAAKAEAKTAHDEIKALRPVVADRAALPDEMREKLDEAIRKFGVE